MQLCFQQPGGGFAAGKNGLGEALLHQHDYLFIYLFISRECEQVVHIHTVKELFKYFCEFKVYHW